MARPSNADLIERVRELEAQVTALEAQLAAAQSDEPNASPLPHRVRGLLKDIVRHPERAVDLAQQALARV